MAVAGFITLHYLSSIVQVLSASPSASPTSAVTNAPTTSDDLTASSGTTWSLLDQILAAVLVRRIPLLHIITAKIMSLP